TSGTESRPKGCFHTWNTIGFTVRGLSKAFGLDRRSVTFAPSPVSHGTGLAMGVAAPILTGGSIHLQDVWQPKEGLARIREHRCTHAATATPFYAWRSTPSSRPRTTSPRCEPGSARARPSRQASQRK